MKYCFYHRVDFDGKMSSAIVKKFIKDITLMPFNYGDPFPFERLTANDDVYFVDVVIQPHDEMKKVYNIVKGNLYIFDHHKSFLESETYKFLTSVIPNNMMCKMTKAGCELTWEYFTTKKLPKSVRLLGQYDSWRDTSNKKFKDDFDWDAEVIPYQFGLRSFNYDIDDLVTLIDNDRADEIIPIGKVIKSYQEEQDKQVMSHSFECVINKFKCLVVNSTTSNSQLFKSKWDKSKYDFMLRFNLIPNKKYSWSVYTDREDLDASVFAKSFGGGGHAGASGFITDSLIF